MLKPILCLIGILVLLLILSHTLKQKQKQKRSEIIVIQKQAPIRVPVEVPILIEKVPKPGPKIDDVESMYYSDLEWYAPLYSTNRPFSSNYYNGSYKTYSL